jgi:hypothetical protein
MTAFLAVFPLLLLQVVISAAPKKEKVYVLTFRARLVSRGSTFTACDENALRLGFDIIY